MWGNGDFARGAMGKAREGGEGARVHVGLLGLMIALAIGFSWVTKPHRVKEEPWPSSPTYVPTMSEEADVARIQHLFEFSNRYWKRRYAELAGGYERSAVSYRGPELAFFSGEVVGACGRRGASRGPFYCHEEGRLYVDLGFLSQAAEAGSGAADWTERYVLAHGMAHHVQHLLGIAEALKRQGDRVSSEEWGRLVLRHELHAEFLAGGLLEAFRGEGGAEKGSEGWAALEELLGWARGSVGVGFRERFEKGSLEQRARWLERGALASDLGAESPFEVSFGAL